MFYPIKLFSHKQRIFIFLSLLGCFFLLFNNRYRFKSNITASELMQAASLGDKNQLVSLLKQGMSVNEKDQEGNTALIYAAKEGHQAIVAYLIENGAKVDVVGNHKECFISSKKDRSIDIHKINNHKDALTYAAEQGHIAIVAYLIDKGADVNGVEKSVNLPLHLAAANGHEAVVRLLLEKGANINAQDCISNSVLHYAVENGQKEVVTILVDKGVNIHSKGKGDRSPLMYAAQFGHKEIAELLLAHGAKVNHKDIYNQTLLMYTAEGGNPVLVQLFLDKGLKINQVSYSRRHALIYATEKGHKAGSGHKDVVALLLDHNADINLRDRYGRSALMYANENHYQVITCLLTAHRTKLNPAVQRNDQARQKKKNRTL